MTGLLYVKSYVRPIGQSWRAQILRVIYADVKRRASRLNEGLLSFLRAVATRTKVAKVILVLVPRTNKYITMAANAGNQRIIPLEEGWNDEIKAKVRRVLADNDNNNNTSSSWTAVLSDCCLGRGCVFFSSPEELACSLLCMAPRAPKSTTPLGAAFCGRVRWLGTFRLNPSSPWPGSVS